MSNKRKYELILEVFKGLTNYIDMEDIAEYCIGNNKTLYNDGIQEILDSEDEETEE